MNDDLMMAFTLNNPPEPLGLLSYIEGERVVRSEGTWFLVGDNNPLFAEIEVIYTKPDFLKFYDKLDSSGSLPDYEQSASYEVKESE